MVDGIALLLPSLLSRTERLASIVPFILAVSIMSGIRRGQASFAEELARSRCFATLCGVEPKQIYVASTSGYAISIAWWSAAFALPTALVGRIFAPQVVSNLTMSVGEVLLVAVFLLARLAASHLATVFRQYQPPQFVYLIWGVAFGSLIAKGTFQDGTAYRSQLSVLPKANFLASSWTLLGTEAIIAILLIFIRSRSIHYLMANGPVSVPGKLMLQFGYWPGCLPLKAWLSKGRSTGSVVFGFSVILSFLCGWLALRRSVLLELPHQYDGSELSAVLSYAGIFVAATLFAAPIDLASIARLRPLLLLARVRVAREVSKLVIAVLVPTAVAGAYVSFLVANVAAMHPVPVMVRIAIYLPILTGCLSLAVLPSLTSIVPGFEGADDEVPVREFFYSGVACLLPTVLAVGFVTVQVRGRVSVFLVVVGLISLACAIAARLALRLRAHSKLGSI